jgi:hypothetical protein
MVEENVMDNLANKSFVDLIVIKQDNKYYRLWRGLDVLCCLVSSYFYVYMGAFNHPRYPEPLFIAMLFFETVFLISMVLKFFVEFIKDGQTIPTRDLA